MWISSYVALLDYRILRYTRNNTRNHKETLPVTASWGFSSFQQPQTFSVEVVPTMLPMVKTYNQHPSRSIIPAKSRNKAGLHVRKMYL